MHRTWHDGIMQAMLSNDKKHQLRPAHMSRGMCTLVRQCKLRKTTYTISHGQYSLGKKCQHTEKGIDHETFVEDCKDLSWLLHIAQ